MKSIIFTVTNDLTYDQRMQKICNSLSKAGYYVTLIGRELDDSLPLKENTYRQKRVRCFFKKGKLFYAEINIRYFFVLLFSRCDIICSIDLDTILPGYFVSRLRGKELVYDAHELFTEVPEVVDRPGVQRFWKKIESFILPRLRYAYTVGPAIAKLFTEKYGTPFEVIMNAPEKKELDLRKQENQPRFILYQGALNKGRGLENLILAMRKINGSLKLAGEGDLSNDLREMVIELGLENKIEFLGKIPPSELEKITASAYIGINVSENLGLSYYYSMNNKVFDYMHAGLPSVTNDFPEYRAINEEFNIMILTQSKEEFLVDAITRLINDEALYGKLKENCLLAADKYNWQAEEKKLIALYARI